jgi:heterodisulfide reductase subunit A-like polyferredoxin
MLLRVRHWGVRDVEELTEYAVTLPGVAISCYNRCVCLDPGRELMNSSIEESKLSQVVLSPFSL